MAKITIEKKRTILDAFIYECILFYDWNTFKPQLSIANELNKFENAFYEHRLSQYMIENMADISVKVMLHGFNKIYNVDLLSTYYDSLHTKRIYTILNGRKESLNPRLDLKRVVKRIKNSKLDILFNLDDFLTTGLITELEAKIDEMQLIRILN